MPRREVITTYVTVDELSEAQCHWLFDTSEQVSFQLREEAEFWWQEHGRETIESVLEDKFWPVVIDARREAKHFCWSDDGYGGFHAWPTRPMQTKIILFRDLWQVLNRYPDINQMHVLMYNALVNSVVWGESGDPGLWCHVHQGTVDKGYALMDGVTDDCELIAHWFDREVVTNNSGDNEWTDYITEVFDRGITEAQNPFLAGLDLSVLLGSVQNAIKVYNETLDWVFDMIEDLQGELGTALDSEWEYMQSYDYWYELASCNGLEYELTEELKNVRN